jgi:hypothetical protein
MAPRSFVTAAEVGPGRALPAANEAEHIAQRRWHWKPRLTAGDLGPTALANHPLGETPRDPGLRCVQTCKGRLFGSGDQTESYLKEPHARFRPVLLGQAHQDSHEEPVGEHKVAFAIIAAGCNLDRLEVQAHPADRFRK